jgi:hypothetical protein
MHGKTRWILIGLGATVALLAVLATVMDWNLARGPISRSIAARTGRTASIEGNIRVHPWSWSPSVEIEGLRLGNPDWATQRDMFSADRIAFTVSLGRLLRGQLVLPRLEVFRPKVALERDAAGHASWQFTDRTGTPPAKTSAPAQLPAVRMLLIREGEITVQDRVRKLALSGTLTAGDQGSGASDTQMQLRLTGSLNAKPLRVDFNGGSLVSVEPTTPYRFNANIVASTIHASAQVSILKPFDLSEFTATLRLTGDDLADAYYLTGLALPNTARYDIAGKVHRTNLLFQIDELRGKIGSSDIQGSVGVDTRKKRFTLNGNLTSNKLDLKDLVPAMGVRTAPLRAGAADGKPGRMLHDTSPQGSALLLPDADLQLDRVRGTDADVTFHAKAVMASRLPMKEVRFHLILDNGVLKLAPVSFILDRGSIAGNVTIDARSGTPQTSIDLGIDHVDLAQFKSAKASDAPLSGQLQGRIHVHGIGTSVHKVASTADGAVGFAIPQGEIKDVLAELTGINVLKGLGLLFTRTNDKAQIRCGLMDFEAKDGTLLAKTFFIDTTNVLITGRGDIHLDSERMDLALQGDPKRMRFVRLRAPVSVTGTMANPTIGIKPGKLVVQSGAALALGALAPVAAALAFIDPGLAKDENCAAALSLAGNQGPERARAGGSQAMPVAAH